jgi:hypothetical protein
MTDSYFLSFMIQTLDSKLSSAKGSSFLVSTSPVSQLRGSELIDICLGSDVIGPVIQADPSRCGRRETVSQPR